MREVVIASSVRTPVGKAYKGTLRTTRPDELAAVTIKGALDRVPQVDPKEIEDVILGCAMPEAEQGMNVARIASLRAGLPVETSAMTINRFCSSGLQAIALAAERIMAGGAEVILAGGVESMTMIPMGGHKVSANPWLVEHYPDAYLSMGLTAERLAQRYGITREQADEFSLHSHQKAITAIQAGKFEEEIVSVPVSFTTPNGAKPKRVDITFKVDEGPRADTSLDALASLKPAFHAKGTVTAGNSSQAVIKEAGLDPSKVNPNGGAVALGHPLGCTGAKLTATILRELKRRGGRYGIVTMCVGGGMGAAGIFENVQ